MFNALMKILTADLFSLLGMGSKPRPKNQSTDSKQGRSPRVSTKKPRSKQHSYRARHKGSPTQLVDASRSNRTRHTQIDVDQVNDDGFLESRFARFAPLEAGTPQTMATFKPRERAQTANKTLANIDQIERDFNAEYNAKRGPTQLHPRAAAVAQRSVFMQVSPPQAVYDSIMDMAQMSPAQKVQTKGLSRAQIENPDSPLTQVFDHDLSQIVPFSTEERVTASAIEEAAVQYASGNTAIAAHTLAHALEYPEELGFSLYNAYRMMLDLLRYNNDALGFVKCAVDFQKTFREEPPLWELPVLSSSIAMSDSPVLHMGQRLDESIIPTLEQIKVISKSQRSIKLDLSDVHFVDERGVELMLRVFGAFEVADYELDLIGAQVVCDQLTPVLMYHKGKAPVNYWRFLLELHRLNDQASAFASIALTYDFHYQQTTVWQPAKHALKYRAANMLTTPTTVVPHAVQPHVLLLRGTIEGDGQELINSIAHEFELSNVVKCDCTQLDRIDFVASGRLLSRMVDWIVEGKTVEFHQLNHCVASLFVVLGFHHVAMVERNRKR